jgi:hypothetical protein
MLRCYRCGNINNPASLFCGSCGNKFSKPKLQKTNRTNLYIILGVFGGLFVMCCGCNFLGSLSKLSSIENRAKKAQDVNISKIEESNKVRSKTEETIKVRTVLNIVDLSNKTVKEVETILGSARYISKKKNTFKLKGFSEGEERVYSLEIPEKSRLTIFSFLKANL